MESKIKALGLLVIVGCLMAPRGIETRATSATWGVVQGTVLIDGPGQPSYVKEARVVLHGDSMISSTVTDGQGEFQFSNIAPGTYTLQATYFGLEAEQNVTVNAGVILQVELPLKLGHAKTPVR